jgi:hypothetical protein
MIIDVAIVRGLFMILQLPEPSMRQVYTTLLLLAMLAMNALAQQNMGWIPVGQGLELDGYRSTVMDGKLYVLAQGTRNAKFYQQIYRLDNGAWTLLIEFPGVSISTFASYKGELYIGGNFPSIDSIPGTRSIARWDGTAWRSVGGTNGTVFAMTEYQGELYVGGRFDSVGGGAINRLARWNGVRWMGVGSGVFVADPVWKGNPVVGVLKIYNDELFVGGVFGSIDNVTSPYIVRWNGTRWAGVGGGLDREPALMEVYNGELYLTTPAAKYAGTVPVQGLARWNGTRWDSVGLHGKWVNVRDMVTYNGRLYVVGGGELWPGGMLAAGSVWDGTSWTDLPRFDSSMYVNFAESYEGELYIGGPFKQFASMELNHVARLGVPSSVSQPLAADAGVILYPNPTTGTVNLQGATGRSAIDVQDLFGRTVLRTVSTGDDLQPVDLSSLAAGTYFLSIPTEQGAVVRNVRIVR